MTSSEEKCCSFDLTSLRFRKCRDVHVTNENRENKHKWNQISNTSLLSLLCMLRTLNNEQISEMSKLTKSRHCSSNNSTFSNFRAPIKERL